MQKLTHMFKEPLVHFILIGAGLFVLYGLVKPTGTINESTLIVSAARQDSIVAQFEATRRRPPTDNEMENLIRNYLREEVLYRQAVALGLDKGDAVVRGRMRQKMEFFAESGARLLTPSDADLQQILDDNADKFLKQPRISFQQVFLGEQPSPTDIDQAQAELLQIGKGVEFINVGQRTLLPKQMALSDASNIESVFGPDFAIALNTAEVGTWAGPVWSAYGQHLVLITDRTEARQLQVNDIRDVLTRDWRFQKSTEMKDKQFEEQLAKYDLVIETRQNP